MGFPTKVQLIKRQASQQWPRPLSEAPRFQGWLPLAARQHGCHGARKDGDLTGQYLQKR
jgi:hypothetical protein